MARTKGDMWKPYQVTAVHNGNTITSSGLASWEYDAIGIFMSMHTDVCFDEIVEIKVVDEKGE